MNINLIKENIVYRDKFTVKKAIKILKNKKISIIGYGVSGANQSLNLKNNKLNVIIGQRRNTKLWKKAVNDGWEVDVNLFNISKAIKKSDIILFSLSDIELTNIWKKIKNILTKGKTVIFNNGFVITFNKYTKIDIPKYINVSIISPEVSEISIRKMFLKNIGFNSSYSIYQKYSNNIEKITYAVGISIGSNILFETTYNKKTYSDLVSKRGVLIGALHGILNAQYTVLRENGHTPIEAFNKTVEELTESLLPLLSRKGIKYILLNCSITTKIGVLNWWKKFYKLNITLFRKLYYKSKHGNESKFIIKHSKNKNYENIIKNRLKEINNSELWKVGKIVRNFRIKKK